ncbi:uncharacterized protein LACBIDRAFT_297798 [Laccaria bicolor S238N-H82]|uniref:Predicted protein n=1 Tax=Laccaria bicolor (strain S238N-H82 / ATCC MYA-4686) TaxID=486041 RepID=B0DAX1_LACBS|nr:uncharacterized protein LACBIDRAFT_297798 [Laccaria bicolor S238N-H82]EDR08280.1 predicted protein [Laccaria bicolor S238N-H82]|eukprot:XP_001881350.1 predicted protein [Laccaria bicolor S238N-H82]
MVHMSFCISKGYLIFKNRILDGFHLALTIHCVYIYSVTGFGIILGLTHIVWSIKLQVALNVYLPFPRRPEGHLSPFLTACTQCASGNVSWLPLCFSLKISDSPLHRISRWISPRNFGLHRGLCCHWGMCHRSRAYVSIVWEIALLLQVSHPISGKRYIVNSYAALANISWIINAALGTSTAIDFVISGAMCYYLRMSQGKASHLDSRISALMQYTLSSGLFTSACSLSAMFSYILLPNTFVFLGITFLLTKLYVGSFLAMLNARERKAPQVATEDEAVHTQQKRINCRVTSSFWSPAPLSPISPGSSTTLGQTKPW